MTDDASEAQRFSLTAWHPGAQWALLLALSLVVGAVCDLIQLPAALLLGAMFAAIFVAVRGAALRMPRKGFVVAQGVIGCLVARGMTPEILVSLRKDWLLFVAITLVVILACSAMGWLLARKEILPGTTAVWGCSPGGASVMTLMADSYGGDMRLVAVMQYLRVVIVTVLASLVAHFWVSDTVTPPGVLFHWSFDVPWQGLAATVALASVGSLLAQALRIPGGALLVPLAIGSALQAYGVVAIVLPPWLLAPTYLVLGWSIGLRFTRQTLAQAARALPSMIVSIACLIAVCAGIAVLLTRITDIDPLSAYLATSPGGLDAVAIIAASAGVNIPFVMASQTSRVLIVIFTGPALARFMARRLAH